FGSPRNIDQASAAAGGEDAGELVTERVAGCCARAAPPTIVKARHTPAHGVRRRGREIRPTLMPSRPTAA
ncbi:MAG: hypothetical protein D6744_12695, partial [Planctomycetota bacterium]